MSNLTVVVRAIREEALDVKSFELVSLKGGPLPSFTAGAHIDVHLGQGLVRQYSLCSSPQDRLRYVIAAKREPHSRGGSKAMHECVKVGQELTIGRPRNNFELSQDAAHHLLLAAGIGVTPILSMAWQLKAEGRSFELRYFNRSAEYSAFRGLLSAGEFADQAAFHDGLSPAAVEVALREVLSAQRVGTHVYMCGPQPFMSLIRALAHHWPQERIHFEYFAAEPSVAQKATTGFKVKLARSGGTYDVSPGQSIVKALAAHGIAVETSCEQGVCGACLTRLIEGVPEHRDAYLSDTEKQAGDQMCLCVSRAKSDVLVLDL